MQSMDQAQSMQPLQSQVPVGRQQQPVPASVGSRLFPQPRAVDPPRTQPSANGAAAEQPTTSRVTNHTNGRRANLNPLQSAEASLETVERALGDLRVSSAQTQAQAPTQANGAARSGGRRGGRLQEHKNGEIKVPATDFDFEGSNARFDKTAITSAQDKTDTAVASGGRIDDSSESPVPDGKSGGELSGSVSPAPGKDKEGDKAYNPKQSFFDSLSSSANALPPPSQGGRGASRRGLGKTRREEERERNVATFGEPGGVGLMGPGAYVGGWGGYGRRGGPARSGGCGGRRGATASGDR